MTAIGKILFEAPSWLFPLYKIPPEWIEGGRLKLYLSPQEYQLTRKIDAGSPYIRTNSGAFGAVRVATTEISMKFAYGQGNLLHFLEHLNTISNTSGYNAHSPIVLLDYVRPEYKHISAGYTVRRGAIISISESSGMVRGWDNKLYQHGFEIQFEQVDRSAW